MSDFLTRLAGRTLGTTPILKPWTPSRFEVGPGLEMVEPFPEAASPVERLRTLEERPTEIAASQPSLPAPPGASPRVEERLAASQKGRGVEAQRPSEIFEQIFEQPAAVSSKTFRQESGAFPPVREEPVHDAVRLRRTPPTGQPEGASATEGSERAETLPSPRSFGPFPTPQDDPEAAVVDLASLGTIPSATSSRGARSAPPAVESERIAEPLFLERPRESAIGGERAVAAGRSRRGPLTTPLVNLEDANAERAVPSLREPETRMEEPLVRSSLVPREVLHEAFGGASEAPQAAGWIAGERVEPEPTIEITIGRIEVKAPPQPPAPRPRPARPGPRISLNEYLRRRREGR
jgi:hypothetical protein